MKKYTLAVLQARMTSSRLFGKVLMDLNGEPMIIRQISRIKQAKRVDDIIVVTSVDPSDDLLVEILEKFKIRVVRGSLEDVLSRFQLVLENFECTALIRLTGDCPLVMPEILDAMIEHFYRSRLDYLSNAIEPSFPDGLDIEVINPAALKKLSTFDLDNSEREHVTLGLYSRATEFQIENYPNSEDLSGMRWTVDYQEDLDFVRQVYANFRGHESTFTFLEVLDFVQENPHVISEIDSSRRNEKLLKIEIMDNGVMSRYSNSTKHLVRAERIIPLGSQTFSKSRTQYPVGISPLYATRAKGAQIWDVDKNRYIDLVNALASVTLGYGDKTLEKAIKKQLKSGVSLSLPDTLEVEVAELIVEMIPSAEMVRFGKNGTDATSAAIRLARAFTGRDHIIVCGYHGWQDWYIGSTTRNKGVPISVSELTHKFEYNNTESLQEVLSKFEGKIAAVIMEPMNAIYPEPGFLESVQKLTLEAGALLIFDETITGFRFARGGAQELFGITPDLSTFGKGMANGFPLSAVVGRRDVMMEMEEIFFSGTFGGELLSLAAAKSVLERQLAGEICEKLADIGDRIASQMESTINRNGLQNVLSLSGHPSWKFLNWHPTEHYSVEELKTYFMQQSFQKGLLVLSTHNVSTAFTDQIIEKTNNIYSDVFADLRRVITENSLRQELKVEPLKPLFRVR